jgi:hypothetical protein
MIVVDNFHIVAAVEILRYIVAAGKLHTAVADILLAADILLVDNILLDILLLSCDIVVAHNRLHPQVILS